jgi:hypothetical protein
MRRVLIYFPTFTPSRKPDRRSWGFHRERPKKMRAFVKCPTCPTGASKNEYIFIMRDSGDAVTMTPRWNAAPLEGGCSVPREWKKPTGRMKRPKRPHDLSSFSSGSTSQAVIAGRIMGPTTTVRRLGKRRGPIIKFGGASGQLT